MSVSQLVPAFQNNQAMIRKVILIAGCFLCLLLLVLTVKALVFPSPKVFAEISIERNAVSKPRWNWYAGPTMPVEVVEEEDDDLQLASINAELLGVVIAGEQSIATLSVSRKPAAAYRLGEELERNVTLEKVEGDRVIISQRGARRQILLKDITGGRNRNGDNKNDLIRVNQASRTSSTGGGFTIPGVGSTLPIQVPGEGMGLSLRDVSSEISDLADLRDGDVITSIDGTPVSDLFRNPTLWQKFGRETRLSMTLIRDEEERQVTVNAAALFQKIVPQIGAGLIE